MTQTDVQAFIVKIESQLAEMKNVKNRIRELTHKGQAAEVEKLRDLLRTNYKLDEAATRIENLAMQFHGIQIEAGLWDDSYNS